MNVRTATHEDLDTVMGMLDAAMLATDRDRIRRSIDAGETVVAVEKGRLLGSAVCVSADPGVRIDSIAVRPRRRGQGVGSALVDTIVERHERVVVAFDERVRPFYEGLGFDISAIESERFRGVRYTDGRNV